MPQGLSKSKSSGHGHSFNRPGPRTTTLHSDSRHRVALATRMYAHSQPLLNYSNEQGQSILGLLSSNSNHYARSPIRWTEDERRTLNHHQRKPGKPSRD